jgi:hypothetical protein
MKERDMFMAQVCKQNNIPIVTLLSGAYEQENFQYIAESMSRMIGHLAQ